MLSSGLVGVDRGVMFVSRSIMLMGGIKMSVRRHPLHCQHDAADEMEEKCLKSLLGHFTNVASLPRCRMIPVQCPAWCDAPGLSRVDTRGKLI